MAHLFTSEELNEMMKTPPPPPSRVQSTHPSINQSPFASTPPQVPYKVQKGRFTVSSSPPAGHSVSSGVPSGPPMSLSSLSSQRQQSLLSSLHPFQSRTSNPVPPQSRYSQPMPLSSLPPSGYPQPMSLSSLPPSVPFQTRSRPFLPRPEYFKNKPSTLPSKAIMNVNGASVPRIEIYEYDIENYTYLNSARFGNFKKREVSDVNERGIVADVLSTYPGEILYHLMESSIDPLVSTDIVKDIPNRPNQIEILNYYKKYKNWKTRIRGPPKRGTYPDSEIPSIKDFYTIPRKRIIAETVRRALEIQQSYVSQFIPTITSIPSATLQYNSLIYQIKLEPGEKLIVFGDFHGSFHTFVRQLFRLYLLGVLNLENYQINEGYRIIFLGDLIDRGNYGIDIIYLITKLMVVNNHADKLKCILNRGNHEDRHIASAYGFTNELREKNIQFDIQELIFRLFDYCSSALVINYEQNRYWCCHGGIPVEKYSERVFNIPTLTDGDISRNYVFYIDNEDISKQIRWNDFTTAEDNINPNRSDYNLFKVGTRSLNAFMKINQIDFIIRGHQDSNYNSCMLSSSQKLKNNAVRTRSLFRLDLDDDWYNLSKVAIDPSLFIPNANKDSVLFEKNPEVNLFFHKAPFTSIQPNYIVNGAVATINTSSGTFRNRSSLVKNIGRGPEYQFYPVITISTNTDNGRPFTKDSFVLLRFDDYDGTSLFTKDYIITSELSLNTILTTDHAGGKKTKRTKTPKKKKRSTSKSKKDKKDKK